MSAKQTSRIRTGLLLSFAASVLAVSGCGGGGSNSSSGSNNNPPPIVNNTQAVEVNFGPAGNFTNGLFTSVTICVPGSTTQCQTIPDVEVDTGSEGLRLLSSQVTLSLPAVTDNTSNGLQECVAFLDGSYVWGPVVGADIQMGGEKGSGVPIQLISTSPTFPVPSSCTSGGGPNDNTVTALGANGILGIGNFRQDCGSGCTTSTPPALYYFCPSGVCSVASVPLAFQVQNPVWTFARDNNGVMITMPSVPDTGAATAAGSLVFGIGTQPDNGMGSAKIYTADRCGNISSTYNGVQYADTGTSCAQGSFFDTGSNGLYFLDATTLGIPDCTDFPSFYCPISTQQYTVTNTGYNGTSGTVTLSVANADQLFKANSGQNAAFSNLGGDSGTGPSTDYFDFGMPFFFGRTLFVGIEGQTGPGGVVGPYYAY